MINSQVLKLVGVMRVLAMTLLDSLTLWTKQQKKQNVLPIDLAREDDGCGSKSSVVRLRSAASCSFGNLSSLDCVR